MNLPTVQDWVIVWGTCWWMCHIWGLWECFTGGLGFGTSTTAYDHYIQYSTPPTGINDPILGEKSCVNTVLRDSPHKALPSAWDATSSVGGFLGGLLNSWVLAAHNFTEHQQKLRGSDDHNSNYFTGMDDWIHLWKESSVEVGDLFKQMMNSVSVIWKFFESLNMVENKEMTPTTKFSVRLR